MRFSLLGDQGILAYLPNEAAAVAFAEQLRRANPPWLQDVVPAYASVGVFFNADLIESHAAVAWLTELASVSRDATIPVEAGHVSQRVTIPVCYEMAPDMARVCDHTGLSCEDVIRLHTGTMFTVYAVGFVPGFPYLGYLPAELCGIPRLPSPRVRVEPGRVAITGRQTAIYPLPSPGGWNLIGRTPLTIVDVADGFFPLRVGDAVRFERIDETCYREQLGERLASPVARLESPARQPE